MPPPFRLELPDRELGNRRQPKILYTKNEYQPEIKITDWNRYAESLPLDNNPYEPGNLNYFLSHYNAYTLAPPEPLTTTTRIMLEQIHSAKEREAVDRLYQIPHKYMVNYVSYKDTTACDTDVKDKICPPLCAESYTTTMQKSYPPPYPYVMQRFSFPKIPFMQNRRFRWVQSPEMSEHKFYDDLYPYQVCQIQHIKGFRAKSYNPLTCMNTDGTLPPERKLKCFKLDY